MREVIAVLRSTSAAIAVFWFNVKVRWAEFRLRRRYQGFGWVEPGER